MIAWMPGVVAGPRAAKLAGPNNDGVRIRFFLPTSIDMGSHQVAVAADRCQSLQDVNPETIGMG